MTTTHTHTHTDPAPEAVDINFLKQEFNKFRAELLGMKDKLSGSASETLDPVSYTHLSRATERTPLRVTGSSYQVLIWLRPCGHWSRLPMIWLPSGSSSR